MMNAENNNNNAAAAAAAADFDEEWEEWDGSTPFWHHCVAGSIAGFTEHSLVYPLDTVRTHIQVCSSCRPNKNFNVSSNNSNKNIIANVVDSVVQRRKRMTKPVLHYTSSSIIMNHHNPPPPSSSSSTALIRNLSSVVTTTSATKPASPNGIVQTIQYLVNEQAAVATKSTIANNATTTTTITTTTITKGSSAGGLARLFRGIQTMIVGCIPAHAVYFSSYEATKATLKHHWYGDMVAGGIASIGHDVIMTPLDTIKQRMQLGHYDGIGQAYRHMIQKEGGYISLYRSFPITLMTNVPYGMIMVSINEYLKEQLTIDSDGERTKKLSLQTTLASSSIAGFVASGCTTPLDRIKTLLQTQTLQPACMVGGGGGTTSKNVFTTGIDCPLLITNSGNSNNSVVIRNWHEAMTKILKEEGGVGLFRGIIPRVLSHTPAVAISWTTYETAKQLLF